MPPGRGRQQGSAPERAPEHRRRPRGARRRLALAGLAVTVAAGAAACSSASGSDRETLVWLINPDSGGQAKVAENCSTDRYRITTQVLPQDASQQRIQLIRRLAAGDSGFDLMSIDPPFTAELANADYLAPLPDDLQQKLREQSFQGAAEAATWQGKLVVAPFWSNTQVLWYRKSFAEKAGLDLADGKPVTWDQLIDAASKDGGTVAVQANKYEGYVVWINSLIAGAGGQIASDTDQGADLSVDIDSDAGRAAAGVIEKLARSKAAPPDLSVSTEGTAAATFGSARGAFMTSWTYIWTNYDASQPAVKRDLGYTRYPRTVAGEPSQPPYGGIGIGVSRFSQHTDDAVAAVACLTSAENQGVNAEITGNMPASSGGYDYPPLRKIYPQDLLDLFQSSLEDAAPRTVTPYWSDISGAIQSTWHPPASVDEDTPGRSASFIEDILQGRKLL